MEKKDYYSIREFMEYFSLSRRQVTGMIERGELKAIKLSKFYRIPRTEIERYENTPAEKKED